MCVEREKGNAAASLEIAKEDKADADKALAAQRKRAARAAAAAAAGQEDAAGTVGREQCRLQAGGTPWWVWSNTRWPRR